MWTFCKPFFFLVKQGATMVIPFAKTLAKKGREGLDENPTSFKVFF